MNALAPRPPLYRNRLVLIVDALGLAIAVLALISRIPVLWEPIHSYDEGLLLSIGNVVLRGGVVFRDVYSNYPPGIYLLLALVWKVTGVSVLAAHVVALLLHIGVAVMSGRLAGRIMGRPICLLPVGVILGWIRALELIPFAWLAGLFTLLLAVELWLRAIATNRRGLWVAAGVVFAAVSYFRHDLFVYAAPLFLALFALPASWARWLGVEPPLRAKPAVWFLAAVGATLAVLWLPLLLMAGPGPVAHDLLLDAAKYVAPARARPTPPLFKIIASSLGIYLPVFLVARFEGAVMLALAAPVLALGLFALLRWFGARAGALAALFLAFVALAVLPQLLGRTDPNHALYCMAPGAAASYALFELAGRKIKWRPVGLLVILAPSLMLAYPVYARIWPTPRVMVPRPDPARSLGLARLGSINETNADLAASRRGLIKFVQENAGPEEAVFFGNQLHSHVDVNESELYFLVDRRPGTRYVNFDPGLVDRAEVQAQMIRQLEANHVRVIALSSRIRGQGPGARLLDDYLARNYPEVSRSGPYSLRLRR